MSAELALARLEAKTLNVGDIARWLKAVDTLKVLLARGSEDIAAIILAMRSPTIEAVARAAILDAFGLGADDALAILEDAGIAAAARRGKPSKGALATVKGLDKLGREAMAQAAKLARVGADVDTMLAPIFGHATRVRGAVSDGINRAGNEGSTAVADAAGVPTVWVAETDACVTCLAYSGRICQPGKAFPGGLTYGKKSYFPGAIKGPPRHRFCRCCVEPLVSREYADALRREADRSVLRGFSLESESMGTRIDAAKRLLEQGVEAPKSVIKYAERWVKAGKFPTRGRP